MEVAEVVLTIFDVRILSFFCALLATIHLYRGFTDSGDKRRSKALRARSAPWYFMSLAFLLISLFNYESLFERMLLRGTFSFTVFTEAAYYYPVICEIIEKIRKRLFNGRANSNCGISTDR